MKVERYETNYKQRIFLRKTEKDSFNNSFEKKENNLILIYPEFKYQQIIGFGGALTESSAYVYSKFPCNVKKNFIDDYFSKDGNNYSLCRTHINSCDFSLKTYSYSENESLEDFSIDNDRKFIIPLIKDVLNVNNEMKFMATPWSPPKFMKSNKNMNCGGKLNPENKDLWARYICKYFLEYKKENIEFEYMTVQNEPNAKQLWESCIFSADEEVDFALNYLIPNLRSNNLNLKVLCWDHNKERLYFRAKNIYSQDVYNLISGMGYHYYTGDHFENIRITREKYPEKLLIHTEGCCGYSFMKWRRQIPNAEIYAHDIIGDLNSGANAYIDWNVLLDYKGGPNHVFNNCYAPILANFSNKNYNKNLAFYYIGHFSRFIKRGACRIGFSKYTDNLEITAFENTDGSIVVVVLNKSEKQERFCVVLNEKYYKDRIDGHSIITLLVNK